MALRAGATRAKQGLQAGATRGGLYAGDTRRTGQGRTTKRFTRTGVTTSQTAAEQREGYVEWLDPKTNEKVSICVRPKPLYPERIQETKTKKGPHIDGQTSQTDASRYDNTETQQDKDSKAGHTKDESKLQAPHGKDATALSQSGLSSSVVESSEDEEAKRKEAEKAAKKAKKGFSEKELNTEVDIELSETATFTIFNIPSVVVAHESEEFQVVDAANKKYEALLQNKLGSDNYNDRGSQTMNLSQKTREIVQRGFVQDNKQLQAAAWDIYDSQQMKLVTDAEKMETEYYAQINEMLEDRIKHPGCMIDAETMAQYNSLEEYQIAAAMAQNSKGVSSSQVNKSNVNQSGKNSSKQRSSQSKNQESVSKSQTSDMMSATSYSQTGTNQMSSEVGAFMIKEKVEYIEQQIPESMLAAIKIIERLMTQSKYQEQHVAYKNYPPVNLERPRFDDDDDEEAKKKGGLMGLARNKKKEKEMEDEKKDEEKIDEDAVTLQKLFDFECEFTKGRHVSAIDINVQNPDLVAVGYGETDITCTNDEQLKPGLLCFWTLKNPKFPEKIIRTEHSITCAQFSKKQPHLIAVGDSHGNISIFNVRDSESTGPIQESKNLNDKHSDIIWEIQWVQRDSKGEALVSISGDGRIIEWSMKKGLEFTELKQLKRETNPNQKDVYAGSETDKKSGGMTFINTGGLSIDFPPQSEGGNYFVATEDCSVHKCQTSFSERYSNNYYGHTGPIYRVRCNPYWDSVKCPIFLTCSYDWTVRVWHDKDSSEKQVCQQISIPLKEQVNDICWSPLTSSVFASVANDGRIEVWDLHRDPLNPRFCHFDPDPEAEDGKDRTSRTVVKFSKSAPVLMAGTADGRVCVYRSHGLEHGPVSDEDQINRLINAIQKDDFASSDKDKKKAEEQK